MQINGKKINIGENGDANAIKWFGVQGIEVKDNTEGKEKLSSKIKKDDKKVDLEEKEYIADEAIDIPASINGNNAVVKLDFTRNITWKDNEGNDYIVANIFSINNKDGIELKDFTIDMCCGRNDDYKYLNNGKRFGYLGTSIEGLHPLEIGTNANNITLENLTIKNNTYAGIRVNGESGNNNINFINLNFENTDCGILYAAEGADIKGVNIQDCSFKGHHMSEPISLFGNNAKYSNVTISGCNFRDKDTSAIAIGGEDNFINQSKDIRIDNCTMVNCTGTLLLRNASEFDINNIKSYVEEFKKDEYHFRQFDNNNYDRIDNADETKELPLRKFKNAVGMSLLNCNDGRLKDITIDSNRFQAMHLDACKGIKIQNLNITKLARDIEADQYEEDEKGNKYLKKANSTVLLMNNCENVTIDDLYIESIDDVQKGILISNSRNCTINIKEFIRKNNGNDESLMIYLENCENVNITVPSDIRCMFYDRKKEDGKNPVDKLVSTNLLSINANVYTLYGANKENIIYTFYNQPLYDKYIIKSGGAASIDLSEIPLRGLKKTIEIELCNVKDKEFEVKLTNGNIENGKDIKLKENEIYKFKLTLNEDKKKWIFEEMNGNSTPMITQ